jgi:hypothetical protein
MRIYELAKKLGVKSKGILCELSKLGIEGKTHSSNIESELIKTIEEILLRGGFEQQEGVHVPEKLIEQQGPPEKKQPMILLEEKKSKALLIPQEERLQVLKRLKKDRWKEYLKYDMPERHIESEKPSEENKTEILTETYKTEAPLQIEIEELKTDVSDEEVRLFENLPVKQENFAEHRAIITVLVISAIFIITVLFFTVINYYVWRDKPHERPQTKSLDLLVQKEESKGQVESGISTLPQDDWVVSQPLFTIQVGAFNDAYYAKALKTRLNKKGYHAFITISSSKKGRFYKVLVGKFSNREKAEMLSAKIKRAEGIQTFVTLWKKQYLKNSKASSLKVSVHKCLAKQETPALYFLYYIS